MKPQARVRTANRDWPKALSVLIGFAVFAAAPFARTTAQSERLKHTLVGHGDGVSAIAFSPDGQTLASVDRSGMLILWNALTGEVKRSMKNEQEVFRAMAFSPDGQTIASGGQIRESASRMSDLGMVTLWDAQTGEIRRKFKVGLNLGLSTRSGGIISVEYSPDGKIVAAGTVNAIIKIWDAQTGKELRVLGGHSEEVRSLAFAPDGLTLASGSNDGSLILWDAKSWKTKHKIKLNNARVRSVVFSPDGKTLATSIILVAKRVSSIIVTPDYFQTIANNRSGIGGVSNVDGYNRVSAGGVVKLWDVDTGKEALELASSQKPIAIVAYSPDGRTVANAVTDNTVRLVTVKNGELLTLRGHTGPVVAVAFSPDGRTVASAGADTTIKLWDVSDYNTTR